jgi:hypothetical protein
MDINIIFSKIGVPSNLIQDVTLLVIVILASFIFGMFIGRYKLLTILVNIYVSVAVLSAVPISLFPDYTYRLIFFFATLIVLTLISKRLFEIYISGSGSGFLWRVFVMSFLEVVFLFSVALSIMPKNVALGYISPTSYEYLASENAHLAWMIIPLAFLFFIHKRINR